MTLQQLEYIMAVYQTGSFTKAAKQCLVTQPTLSAMIQKLEEELQVKIFDRDKQPVVPTAIGKVVLQQARSLLSQASHIQDHIEEERHSLSGIFRIGVLPTIAPYLLPRFFPLLTKKYPQLDIRVMELKTNAIKQALADGEIDAGIVASLYGMDDFDMHTLYYEQFFGYVARCEKQFEHERIRTADIKDQQLWLLDEGHCFRDQLVQFCQLSAAKQSQRTYRLGSIETFMRMVEGGKGITFIPELAIDQLSDIQKELVRPFAIPCPTRQIVLLTSKDFIRASVRDLLIDEIQKAVPKQMLSKQVTQQLI
jgi:LysR family hydrogen peroxide-inducible transcriptional activator